MNWDSPRILQCHVYEMLENKMSCGAHTFRNLSTSELLGLSQLECELYDTNAHDLIDSDQAIFILKQRGQCPMDIDTKIKLAESEIETAKVDIYKSFFITNIQPKKNKLQQLKKRHLQLIEKKNSLYHLTLEAHVTSCVLQERVRIAYLGNPIDLRNLVISYNSALFNETLVRRIATFPQWQYVWRAEKPNPFDCHSGCLNENQKFVCSLSQMYDNVYESSEPPHPDIIEDDDALDGWFIVKRREARKSQMDNTVGSNFSSQDHPHRFVPVQNQEEAQKVYELNRT